MKPSHNGKFVLSMLLILFMAIFSGCAGDDSNGAKAPFSEMLQKLTASDAQLDDRFGYSVSIDGDYAIVGAYQEDDEGTNAGAAYIFHRTGPDTWDTGTKIVAPDAQAGDWFGMSVSISSDYAIVGAVPAAAAYIFHRTGPNEWDTGTKIVAYDAQPMDFFGFSVSISGEYAIVGAIDENGGVGDPLVDAGAAYIFHRTGLNTWDGGTKIVASDAQSFDAFGIFVSVSGDYAIVGAPNEAGGAGDPLYGAGAAYIFRRTETNTWDAGTKIVAPDAQEYAGFGISVSISGDYVVVGAPGEAGGTGDQVYGAGAAYVFLRIGTNTWDAGTKIVAFDAEQNESFGSSVSIYEDYVIVGVPDEYRIDVAPMLSVGAAYIYHRTGTNAWDTGVKIVAPDAQDSDSFGNSVSISAGNAIVGAHLENGGTGDPLPYSGAAYLY